MLDLKTLAQNIRRLTPAKDRAPVQRVVQRLRDDGRVTPSRIVLDTELGVIGDRWAAGRSPKPDAQVTLMRFDVASVMTEGAEVAILGDNLFASLDTSAQNLPPGTVVRVGTARCEVTPKPHRGCKKFAARVGEDAWTLTGAPEWEAEQLRGVHLRVLDSGEGGIGYEIVVESRPAAPPDRGP